MPNWCNNVVTIKHMDEKAIDRICNHKNMLVRDTQGVEVPAGLFQAFHPIPEPLMIPAIFGDVDAAMQERRDFNMKEYGAIDWYNWCIANWGTKWDASSVDIKRIDDTTVELTFDTAWSPPIEWYRHMETLGYSVDAKFIETGMCFYGYYLDNNIEENNYSGLEDITQDIIDAFPWILDYYNPDEEEAALPENSDDAIKGLPGGNP